MITDRYIGTMLSHHVANVDGGVGRLSLWSGRDGREDCHVSC